MLKASISLGESRKSRIVIATAVPSQMLRPSEAPIPSSTTTAIMAVTRRANGLQPLQKMSEQTKGKQSSKKPPYVRWCEKFPLP